MRLVSYDAGFQSKPDHTVTCGRSHKSLEVSGIGRACFQYHFSLSSSVITIFFFLFNKDHKNPEF